MACERRSAPIRSTTTRPAAGHGYIYEVPAFGTATAQPLIDMERLTHEAVAVDPNTGIVYETEDNGANSGFYRFIPNQPGQLHLGGRLQMLGVVGTPRYSTLTNETPFVRLAAEWFDIANPNPGSGQQSVYTQGRNLGGAQFGRLEGAWWGNGVIYFVSTSGGNAGQGQIWVYDPTASELMLLFESPNSNILNAPDNICVSPRGGLVLCGDGNGSEFLHGLTNQGEIFKFCQNNVILSGQRGFTGNFTDSEFAGATYSPDGKWLFVNIQSPGITFAITGPWGLGAL